MAMGLVLAAASTMAACGTTKTATASTTAEAASGQEEVNASSASSSESTTVEGEVASVDGNTITVNVGTADSGDSSELTLTGETKTVTVTDDTTYEYQGGMGGAPSGEAPSGEAPSGGGSSENGKEDVSGSSDESSSDDSDSASSGKAPEKPSGDSGSAPSGEAPSGEAPSGNPPAKPGEDSSSSGSSDSSDSEKQAPSGEAPSGEAPSGEAPSGGAPGNMGEASIDSLTEGTHVIITLADDGTANTVTIVNAGGGATGNGAGGGQSSAADVTYTSDNDISEDTTLSDQTIDSTGTDEEGVLVDNGATARLSGLTVNRTSDDSTGGDNASFYGVGASVLTTDGTTYLSDSNITSDAKGGAGVFSYGDGVTYVADTTINTSKDTSGGIHVAGGGTLYAYDDTVTTAGESSAAIRSDRGGGTMVVDGGSYTSDGTGSPAVYSTADITVHDADLTADNSEAVCIEGLNSLRLFDCNLTGNMPDNEQNDCTWNVILYQSMSGDSEEGNSTFEMTGGTLTAKNGGMFYTTNTESTFVLDDVDITYADDNDFFLKCTGNANQRGWGTSGENGADCNFTAIDQEMEGDIIWDSISKLDFYMTGSSTLTGAVTDDESNAGDGGDGYCNLTIESGSTWVVTGDSTLTSLNNAGTIVDADGNTVTIVGTDGTTYVEGNSSYTITTDSYSTDADTSGASAADSWEDYEVARPEELSAD